MANHRRRVNALRALVAGSVLGANPVAATVDAEFLELIRVGRVRILARRYLLQVLHATRALDSTLRAFLIHHGILGGANALGQYLRALRDNATGIPAALAEAQRANYQNTVVNPRNTFMHQAGAAPLNDAQVANLLAEMDACLVDVFNL